MIFTDPIDKQVGREVREVIQTYLAENHDLEQFPRELFDLFIEKYQVFHSITEDP